MNALFRVSWPWIHKNLKLPLMHCYTIHFCAIGTNIFTKTQWTLFSSDGWLSLQLMDSISRDCNKKHWNKQLRMKHKLSASILIPILAGYLYSAAKVGIKMQELNFISSQLPVTVFLLQSQLILKNSIFSCTCLCTFLPEQLYSYMHSRKHVQI